MKKFILYPLVACLYFLVASTGVTAQDLKYRSQMRAVDFQRDGKVIGLRLFSIVPESNWSRWGFLNGDVLKSMNGESIVDLSQPIRIIEGSDMVHAIILRENKDIELNFPGLKNTKSAITNDGSGQKTPK